MVCHGAKLVFDRPNVIVRGSAAFDGQVQRGRHHHEPGRGKAEEPPDQPIGHPVVLCAADAVDEEIAEGKPCPKRRDERSRADAHAGALPFHELLDRAGGVTLRRQRQPGFPRLPIGENNFAWNDFRKQPAAAWVVNGPHPQRGLQPRSVFGQVGRRVETVPHAMQSAVLAQRFVVDRAEFRQTGQQVRDEPLERLAAARPTLWNLQGFQTPRAFQLMAGLDQTSAEVVGMSRLRLTNGQYCFNSGSATNDAICSIARRPNESNRSRSSIFRSS